MAFCVYCGKDIPEGGACGCPGAQAAQPPAAPAAPVQTAAPAAVPAQPGAVAPQQPVAGAPAPAAPVPNPAPQYGAPAQPGQQPPYAPGQQAGYNPVQPAYNPVQPGAQGQPVMQGMQQTAQQVAGNPMVKSALDTIKGMLSPKAALAVRAAGAKTDMSWLLILAVGLLGAGLSAGWYTGSLVKEMYGGYLSMDFSDFMEVFVKGLLGFGILFFTVVLLVMAIMGISKKAVNFTRIANMVAAAFVPTIALVLVAAFLGIFWVGGSGFFTLLSVVPPIILVYAGLEGLDHFENPPVWLYIIGVCVTLGVLALVAVKLVPYVLIGTLYKLVEGASATYW